MEPRSRALVAQSLSHWSTKEALNLLPEFTSWIYFLNLHPTDVELDQGTAFSQYNVGTHIECRSGVWALIHVCLHSLLWEYLPPPLKDHSPYSSKPSDDACGMKGWWNKLELQLATAWSRVVPAGPKTWRRATQPNPAHISPATADPKPQNWGLMM